MFHMNMKGTLHMKKIRGKTGPRFEFQFFLSGSKIPESVSAASRCTGIA